MITSLFEQVQLLVGTLNSWITQALHGNTIVAGAVTASIVGSVFFLLRKAPQQLWARMRRYILFTYDIEYKIENYGSSMIQDIASKFEYELQRRVSKRRASARLVTRNKRIVETLSDGGFFFRYNGAWIYASRREEKTDPKASSVPAELRITLSLTSLRFNRSKMIDVLSESAREYMVPGIYQITSPNYSGVPGVNRVRNFTSIPILAIDAEVKRRVDEAVDNFVRQREANNAADRPHKLTFMFYGEPGTGKSALAEYIAFRLKTSLFCANALSGEAGRPINLSSIIDVVRENISDAEVPVVLADDFDTFWDGLRKRAPKRRNDVDSTEPIQAPPEDSVTLGRLLVSLQSPTEVNDCVVIFTTNHLEKIDPAMYRPGRITLLLEVGRMAPKSIIEYFELSYGQKWPAALPIERSLRACDIASFYNSNGSNPQGFINAIISTTAADDEMFQNKTSETIS